MRQRLSSVLLMAFVAATANPFGAPWRLVPGASLQAADDSEGRGQVNAGVPATVAEARDRARLLHETIHGALQVMHRDYFRDDAKLTIPSKSLEDVFQELSAPPSGRTALAGSEYRRDER